MFDSETKKQLLDKAMKAFPEAPLEALEEHLVAYEGLQAKIGEGTLTADDENALNDLAQVFHPPGVRSLP